MNVSSTTNRANRGVRAAAAVLLVLGLGAAGGAFAFGGHGGHGGPYGAGAGGDGFAPQALETLRGKLNLNTSQQALFDQAAAAGRTAREAAWTSGQKVRDAMRAELAKAEPDLAAVATVADGVQAQNQATRRTVRDQWLKLYATFSAEQKAVVREFLASRIDRFESRRHGMRGRPLPPAN